MVDTWLLQASSRCAAIYLIHGCWARIEPSFPSLSVQLLAQSLGQSTCSVYFCWLDKTYWFSCFNMSMGGSFIWQEFVKNLECARHCARHWVYKDPRELTYLLVSFSHDPGMKLLSLCLITQVRKSRRKRLKTCLRSQRQWVMEFKPGRLALGIILPTCGENSLCQGPVP